MDEKASKYEHYKPILVELVAFAKRPGMYVGREELDNILSFLGGVELSTKFKLRFSDDLVNHIFAKYPDNDKLQDLKQSQNFFTLKTQAEVLSRTTGQDSLNVFKAEALDMLVHVSDVELNGYYLLTLKSHLKHALVKNLEYKDSTFGKPFLSSPEDLIYTFLKEWPGKTLSNEELKLLESIVDINSKRKVAWENHQDGDIDNRRELREVSKQLLVLLSIGTSTS